jgi:hypothetical protein
MVRTDMTTIFDRILETRSPGERFLEKGSHAHLVVKSAEGLREPLDREVAAAHALETLERVFGSRAATASE